MFFVSIALSLAAAPVQSIAATPAPSVSLLQLTLTLDPQTIASADAGKKVAAFKAASEQLTRCDAVEAVAKDVGATVIANRAMPLSAIPEPLRGRVATMPIGTATPLFGDRAAGIVRALVVCARSAAR